MFRWKNAVLAAAVCSALALTSCSGNAEGSPSSGGSLTLGSTFAPATFDPAGGDWGNRAPYYQAVYDTLLLATSEGKIEPFLAKSWEYSPDNTVLTLSLRDDVTFTDGTKLTAAVVKQNLERFKTGTSPNAGYLSGVTTIAASNETTVVLTLKAPDPALLNYLTRDAGLVASAKAMENAKELATHPVGSGPYVLDTAATVTGTSYVYTKNPHYWNPALQHYDKLTINLLADPTAALNALKAGEINATKLANNNNLDEVQRAGWSIQSNEIDFQGILLLDRGGKISAPLADVRVRQAINYAFDREALLKALQSGKGTVTTQVFNKNSAAFDKDLNNRYQYNPAKAKELMAAAGYANGFTLQMPTTAAFGATTYTLLAQQLGDIGIKVQFTDAGQNHVADILAPKYPAAYMSLETSPDWQLIQFMLAPGAPWNPFHYADPKVDELIAKIRTADVSTRGQLAKELNTYIVDQAWFAPLYRKQVSVATDAHTTVKLMPTNVYPAIYDFAPKG